MQFVSKYISHAHTVYLLYSLQTPAIHQHYLHTFQSELIKVLLTFVGAAYCCRIR